MSKLKNQMNNRHKIAKPKTEKLKIQSNWQTDEMNWNDINDMQWLASCFCFNWQLVKRLHHLRHLQLLVQVLKAPAVFAFLWHYLFKTEKGGKREKNLWQESPVTKSTNVIGHVWTCHDSFEQLSIICEINSDLVRFRCARHLKGTMCMQCLRCLPSQWWRGALY